MTATTTEAAVEHASGPGVGRVARVIGPVVDIEFPSDQIPEIYNALQVDIDLSAQGEGEAEGATTMTLEVAQHLGDSLIRAIALKPTDGLVRGALVRDTGEAISVPVGDITNGNRDGATGVLDDRAADQAVGGLQGDGAHHVVAEVLSYLERHVEDALVLTLRGQVDVDLERVVDVRKSIRGEFDVDDGADDASNAADHDVLRGVRGGGLGGLGGCHGLSFPVTKPTRAHPRPRRSR